ncbi:YjjG family noncanonical pyrimidine nucleotidase [Psychroflexus sp. ALD_RP9]|uniref:YjjG family noncanonical pyrimidine nucleotidase n=1 Tax=Psychroflexus sp. ALD_RP9 TaxID=2777186 RepID=UPI001A900FF5|nr:YjjG family noncanonical pyrimidine nucleotidase [Psychroflexus sp. ALD_RP9]QSS97763.1 noncanonical pyrimidine nucleotidase, YjjG family [Psychroflexus sp. ALD_RP9]
MKPFKHIFFDLDHTLWDFNKNSGLTFESIFKKHNIELNLSEFLPVYEPINEKYWKLFRENKISKEDLRYARLNEAFKVLNFKAEPNLVIALSESYIEHLSDFNHLFPYAIEVLEHLQETYHLHLITNGFRGVQYRKMTSSRIINFFETVTTSEDVGVKKPDPAIFNYALKLAQASSSESVMIGDNLEADIEGAEKVGMASIFFGKDDTFEGESVQCLSELKNIL